MSLVIVFIAIVLLILLITWAKVNAFLAFIVVCIFAGLALHLPPASIMTSIEKGMGDMLGSLVIIIALGAMLGKQVAASGAAQQIAQSLVHAFGKKYIAWALTLTGFVVGIPLFYGVGFVLMVPLIFSVTYRYQLPAVATGLPLLAALSVTHGFLPPHPSPSALVALFHANMGITLLYGLIIAIPTVIIAGPVFSSSLKNIASTPLSAFQIQLIETEKLPGVFISFFVPLIPVLFIGLATGIQSLGNTESFLYQVSGFMGNPSIALLIALAAATFFLKGPEQETISVTMNRYGEAVKDVVMILLIIGGAGSLKEILTQSGISNQIAHILEGTAIPPLVLGWLIAALIRVCVGSSTVAGLTTAGILLPYLTAQGVNTNLMVLSIGAGSLFFSHVNDPGFWMFKEYFNVSMKDTFRSWSLMESIVSVLGLAGVLLLNVFV
ncbi:MAG: gluconate transporter [Sphingobacteriales bacterium]|uniref:gluconate:H+ symporter n=1 Tax=Hydrotalea flava TaxID=714549 RepID=UPI0008297A02|nr:gluconate:H+ symporter [Hydrotalea flava]RTL47624.1 MAG: gluconate transporter [Sphingobacteriales bacterium]